MTTKQALAELRKSGTAQTRKVYRRHGVGENQYGVSFADMRRIAKQIKTDHELALALWKTGNHDARILATFVADPGQMSRKTLDDWARELDCYVLTDQFVGLAGKTAHRRDKMEKWSKSKDEWTGRAGWALLGTLATHDEELPDVYFEKHLAAIEKQVHGRKNRVRDAMNTALISIGVRNRSLEKKAVAAARRIGTVEVDHGETGCKTQDAVAYIQKTLEYRKKKAKAGGHAQAQVKAKREARPKPAATKAKAKR